MKLPCVRTTEEMDFAVVGIPFDTGAAFKPGQRFGPASVRENSILLRPYSLNLGVDIFEWLSGVDYGDLSVLPGFIEDSYRLIEAELTPLFEAGVVPLSIGGDHSITLAELRAAAKKYGPVALLHFDSHTDTWDNYWGKKYTHGTPFRRAAEEGLIDGTASIQVGIRGSQYAAEDLEVSQRLGIEVITANQIHELGVGQTGELIRQRVRDRKVFFSFDIDFVDPAYAPGTGTAEVGGFTGYETMALIREAKDLNFIGFDVVEVLPALDPAGITAQMAANVIHEFISILALRKKRDSESYAAG